MIMFHNGKHNDCKYLDLDDVEDIICRPRADLVRDSWDGPFNKTSAQSNNESINYMKIIYLKKMNTLHSFKLQN